MSLQDKLDTFKADFEGNKAPPEVVAIMRKATADLIASGRAEKALKAGMRAPEFALPDAHGQVVPSSELLQKGPLVVTFYRGVWCPYCNMDLQAIEAAANDIRALGASLVAISPQTAPNRRKSERENALSFPILSDHGNALANEFGLRFRLPDDLITVYKGFGNDLAIGNGEDSWTLPMPARYVIRTDGVIVYAEVNADYTRRPDPSELLPVLSRLKVGAAA
ncbi:MAG: peroxiredoxin-like family protein [Roseiarcus sp.]|uniref:peroxiredoxin-like family protein n=1 Tax=Roseiarcus sp. TaxID=1969460 RepID=UPI003C6B6C86